MSAQPRRLRGIRRITISPSVAYAMARQYTDTVSLNMSSGPNHVDRFGNRRTSAAAVSAIVAAHNPAATLCSGISLTT